MELLTPQLDDIGPQLLSYLAQHLGNVVEEDPEGFCELGEDMIAELLAHPYVVCPLRSFPSSSLSSSCLLTST